MDLLGGRQKGLDIMEDDYTEEYVIAFSERAAMLCDLSLQTFSANVQTARAIQDLGNLTVELSKALQLDPSVGSIKERIAECYLAITQMMMVFGAVDIQDVLTDKLNYMEFRINRHRGTKLNPDGMN